MISSFDPIINEKSEILILGSMPGAESLRQHQYYAQKTNAFWKIIFDLFDEPFSENYSDRVNVVLHNELALWDVLSSCERDGSLDSNIKNEEANDLIGLLQRYPNIKMICFNGKKAYDSYKRWIGFDKNADIRYVRLPSTSAAHAIKYVDKREAWEILNNK